MRVIYALSTVALLCGVWRGVEAAKHFETVYSWTQIDYVFPSDEVKATMIADKAFVPGHAVPADMAIDEHTGRTFVSTPKWEFGIPYTLSTVSETKNAKGEHLLKPYPNYEMHTTGCDGISSVLSIETDQCGRLWVMDNGDVMIKDPAHGMVHDCPPKMIVFDLKTNEVIKTHAFRPSMFNAQDSFSGHIAIDVLSTDNNCAATFAYIADTGRFDMIVYDFAHDDAWIVENNMFYPDPNFGHYHYKGFHFDGMFGLHGMGLTPKHDGEATLLYFSSMASVKDSYVDTSVFRNKTYFAHDPKPSHDMKHHVYEQFHTMPIPRPGGQACLGPIFHEAWFYGSYLESAVYCWNYKKEYTTANIVEVDKDETAFDMFTKLEAVTQDGVPHLYVMSNSYEKFMFDPKPNGEEVVFRIMKAPINKLIEGTPCAST